MIGGYIQMDEYEYEYGDRDYNDTELLIADATDLDE